MSVELKSGLLGLFWVANDPIFLHVDNGSSNQTAKVRAALGFYQKICILTF